jgi:hypothetical protein
VASGILEAMSTKLGTGAWAGVGSIVGLFVGSIVGGMLTKGKPVQSGSAVASLVVPALVGTAAGAFAGAALAAPPENTTTTSVTTTGA